MGVAIVSDEPEVSGLQEDAIISALYARLRATFLPHQHPAYDVDAGLRRFTAWMEAHPEAAPDTDEPGLGLVNGGVFINYRGADTRSCGVLLYSELSRRFVSDNVSANTE